MWGIRLQGIIQEVIFRDVVLENSKTGEKVSFGDYHLKRRRRLSGLQIQNGRTIPSAAGQKNWMAFRAFRFFLDGRMKIIITAGRWEAGRIMIFAQQKDKRALFRFDPEPYPGQQRTGIFTETAGVRTYGAHWVDGRLCAETEDKPVVTEPLYYGASRDEADQTVILKGGKSAGARCKRTYYHEGYVQQQASGNRLYHACGFGGGK